MEIRELRDADRQSLSLLIARVYKEMPDSMNFSKEPSAQEIEGHVRAKLAGLRSRSLVDMVALEDGSVIADCEIVRRGAAGVVGIIIADEYRNRGVGRKLLEACMQEAAGIGLRIVYAEIMRTNASAVAFFSGMGFKEHALGNEKVALSRTL